MNTFNNSNTAAAPATAPADSFEHLNLNDVDTTASAVDTDVYTLEINKLVPKYRKINKPDSPFCGQDVLVLSGSYTIVDNDKYNGKKLWKDFWTPFKGAQIGLKKQMTATGVSQSDGQTLIEYAEQFGLLNPPARFTVPIEKKQDPRDPNGAPINEINMYQAKPC